MPLSHFDTEALLDRASAGDAAAMDQLLLRHRSRLRTMVGVRLDPRLAARIDPSDVVQEALLEAHRRFPEYVSERPIPFYPWLRQLAWERLVHLHQKHRFTKKRSVHREEAFDPLLSDDSLAVLAKRVFAADSGPVRHVLQAEIQSRVRAALGQLSSTDREVLILRYIEQLSFDEVGDVLGLGESAVMMRHLRALRRLRPLLEKP